MKRALIIGFPYKFQIDIIDRCNIEPIYWLASQTKDVNEIKKRSIWHNADKVDQTENYSKDSKRTLFPELEQQFFDQNPKFCLDNIRAYFDRKDRFGDSLTFDEARRNLYRDTSFWHYIFDLHNIIIILLLAGQNERKRNERQSKREHRQGSSGHRKGCRRRCRCSQIQSRGNEKERGSEGETSCRTGTIYFI